MIESIGNTDDIRQHAAGRLQPGRAPRRLFQGCESVDRTTSSRALVGAAFAAENAHLTVAMEMSSVEVLKRLAELGFGVAIVPRFSVQRELQSGTLAVLRLRRFGAARSVGALTPRAFTPTRAAGAFLALARAHAHSKPSRSSSSSDSE